MERLATIDGIGLPDGAEQARDRMVSFLDGLRRGVSSRPMPTVADAAQRLLKVWTGLDPSFALELASRGTRPVAGGVEWRYDPRHRLRSATPYRQAHHREFLVAITCPVLSVHPEHALFAPADVALLESAIVDLRVEVLHGAGHMAALDAPEALGRMLQKFLDAPIL